MEQTKSDDQGYTGLHLMEALSLILTYDFNNATSYVIGTLFYKIAVSCITKCVTESPMKMMTRGLESVEQIYNSLCGQ